MDPAPPVGPSKSFAWESVLLPRSNNAGFYGIRILIQILTELLHSFQKSIVCESVILVR
jgi:hypothetical protein